jgi:hypothetical protein
MATGGGAGVWILVKCVAASAMHWRVSLILRRFDEDSTPTNAPNSASAVAAKVVNNRQEFFVSTSFMFGVAVIDMVAAIIVTHRFCRLGLNHFLSNCAAS